MTHAITLSSVATSDEKMSRSGPMSVSNDYT